MDEKVLDALFIGKELAEIHEEDHDECGRLARNFIRLFNELIK